MILRTKRFLFSGMGLLFAVILFVAVTIVVNTVLVNWRLDVTENKLYSLSSGTIRLLERIEEPLLFKLYFSKKSMSGYPALLNYGNRVQDLLHEYAAHAGGRFKLEVIDPEPFSEVEDVAMANGMHGLSVSGAGDKIYLGLVATNAVDKRRIIPFFQSTRESSLEYDLNKVLFNLLEIEKPTVGVMSTLPIMEDPATGRKAWSIIAALRDFFRVTEVSTDIKHIDQSIDLLFLVHPKKLNLPTLFAIDQYLLGGGRAVIFVDPLSEVDNPRVDPKQPSVMGQMNSDLAEIFSAWGLRLVPEKIATDIKIAMRVVAGDRGEQVDYLPWLDLGPENINRNDFITKQLTSINFGTAGILEHTAEKAAGIHFAPLLYTGSQAARMERDLVLFQRDPDILLRSYQPESGALVLAARLTGKAKTAFPEGKPIVGGLRETAPPSVPLTEGDLDVVVVADTDLLRDLFWLRAGSFLGIGSSELISNNADFVSNAVENLLGGAQLSGLRSRGRYERPFTVVEDLRRRAEMKFREREQQLQARLQELEQQIQNLQKSDTGSLLLSEEQGEALERFMQDRLEARRALRAVHHDLRGDIKSLGDYMYFINIAFVPLLIVLLSVVVVVGRRYRSRPKD